MTQGMREFLAALARAGARVMVIGGYALAFYGRPRMTKDLDLWVNPKEARQLLAAIRDFFGEDLGLTEEDLTTPGVVQLGYAPNRIDLVLLDEPDFDAAYARSHVYEVGGTPVHVAAKEDLIALKKDFGRPQNRWDIAELEEE